MKTDNYLIKIINIFAHSSSRILMVSSNNIDCEHCKNHFAEKHFFIIDQSKQDLIRLLEEPDHINNYDLIIMDRVWDNPAELSASFAKQKTRKSILENIDKAMTDKGEILYIAQNKLNLKKPVIFIKSIISFITMGSCSPFRNSYMGSLKKAGYKNIKSFFLFAEITNISRIISTSKMATLDFTVKSHNLTHDLPKQISLWPKWILVRLGIDAWLMTNYLFWGRK